jgi:ribosomal protein L11 methyltransferase
VPGRPSPALDIVTLPDAVLPDDFTDTVAAVIDGHEAIALEGEGRGPWRVHFGDGPARDRAHGALAGALAAWCAIHPIDVPDEGWTEKVQAALGPVRVGRIIVAPPWDVPVAAGVPAGPPRQAPPLPEPPLVIVIEPSMGFGTGHHQSTRLCLAALQDLPLRGMRVIDVGTGSGVLALAARRLGAADVLAIDHDADSVAAARRNAALNGLAGEVRVALADVSGPGLGAFDVVLANLTAWHFQRHAAALVSAVGPGGRCVTSGYTRDQTAGVVEALAPLEVERTREEDDWIAIVFRRPGVRRPPERK